MAAVSSDEVNALVYRYLLEAGFVHAAYTFGQESWAAAAETHVPPGMLVTLLQKGLFYASVEAHLNEDGSERPCTRPFGLLAPHLCDAPPQAELAAAVDAVAPVAGPGPLVPPPSAEAIDAVMADTRRLAGNTRKTEVPRAPQAGAKKRKAKKPVEEPDATPEKKMHVEPTPMADALPKLEATHFSNGDDSHNPQAHGGFSRPAVLGASFPSLQTLSRHRSAAVVAAWCPGRGIHVLASASSDGTAALWTVPAEGVWNATDAEASVRILDHAGAEVTCASWAPDGLALATGAGDGRVRVWSVDGELLAVLARHGGPVCQVQWSTDGLMLASAGAEPSVVVWAGGPAEMALHREYAPNAAPALDVDWRADGLLASCGTDCAVRIYDPALNSADALHTLSGHTGEANAVRWAPGADLLVSASDDRTARVWRISGEDARLVAILAGHEGDVYSARWAPGGRALATASLDSTVRQWDLSALSLEEEAPVIVRPFLSLAAHSTAAYAVTYSPCGRMLATGGLDGAVHLWPVGGETPLCSHSGSHGVFDVAWAAGGHRIAAVSSEGAVSVFDVPRL